MENYEKTYQIHYEGQEPYETVSDYDAFEASRTGASVIETTTIEIGNYKTHVKVVIETRW